MPATKFGLARVEALSHLLEIEVPILLSPMANAAGYLLAASVTNSGGLGGIPCASWSAAQIKQEVEQYRAAAPAHPNLLNMNFFSHVPVRDPTIIRRQGAGWRAYLEPHYEQWGIPQASREGGSGTPRNPFDESALVQLDFARPSVVSFHFGLPTPQLLSAVRSICPGVKIMSSATTVAEAQYLSRNGADVIVCQGIEAGGHRGHFLSTDVTLQLSTRHLVKRAFEVCGDVPLVAAGGICGAKDVREMIELGASGVQVGTAFLLCPEATPNPFLKRRLSDAATPMPSPTEITRAYTGGAARGYVTPFTRELSVCGEECPIPSFPLASDALGVLRAKAEAAGDDRFTPMFAGSGRAIPNCSAAQVVCDLAGGLYR